MSNDAVAAPLIYEVNLLIESAIADAYRAWLRTHIAEMLAIDGFLAAHMFAVDDPPSPADAVALCVQYHVRDAAALQRYFDAHAPRLRADGIARFGARFSATRRVLRILD